MTKVLELVVNPRAGGGRAGRQLGDVVRALASAGFDVEVHRTERPRHAGAIVRSLITRGDAPTIAVMGGDGSFHDALDGLRDESGALDTRGATFALVPAGTGGDLRKTLKIPQDFDEMARYLADATPRPFDLGLLDYLDDRGAKGSCLFGNVASFGIGGLVDRAVNEGPKWIGGRAAFVLASIKASAQYKNAEVRVTTDDELFYEGPLFNCAVANGRYFGAGMFIAPEADVRDGLFDVVALCDMNRLESTLLGKDIFRGTHIGRRNVRYRRAKVVKAERIGMRDALLDVDGETPGRIDATFTMLPSALRVLAGE